MLSRYYPSDVEMHSFENVLSAERKRANWVVLEKLFKVCAARQACAGVSLRSALAAATAAAGQRGQRELSQQGHA